MILSDAGKFVDMKWIAPFGEFDKSIVNSKILKIGPASSQEKQKLHIPSYIFKDISALQSSIDVGSAALEQLNTCKGFVDFSLSEIKCIDDLYTGGKCPPDWRLIASNVSQYVFADISTSKTIGKSINLWLYVRYFADDNLRESTYNMSFNCEQGSFQQIFDYDVYRTEDFSLEGITDSITPPKNTVASQMVSSICSQHFGRNIANPLKAAFDMHR